MPAGCASTTSRRCDDYLGVMDSAVKKYHIALPDRQFACAPVDSPEGRRYLGAMRCAVNYAFANRQVIAHHTRKAFEKALGMSAAQVGLRTVYEVAHNIAEFETHIVDGREPRLCVHRKGATRAFAPGCGEVPPEYHAIGDDATRRMGVQKVKEMIEELYRECSKRNGEMRATGLMVAKAKLSGWPAST